jgi:hypothetical protein
MVFLFFYLGCTFKCNGINENFSIFTYFDHIRKQVKKCEECILKNTSSQLCHYVKEELEDEIVNYLIKKKKGKIKCEISDKEYIKDRHISEFEDKVVQKCSTKM